MGRVFKQKQLRDSVVRVNRKTGNMEKMSDVRKQQSDESNKEQEVVSTPFSNTSIPTIDTTPAIVQPSVNELKGTQNVGLDEVSTDFNVSSQGTETDDKLKELLKKK